MPDATSPPKKESRWPRRLILKAVGGTTAIGLSTLTSRVVRAGHETDPCPVTFDFNREKVARVFDVQAARLTSLTVFYFDRDGTARKQENIDPTNNADYGELTVRYDAAEDKTIIHIGGPNTAIRRIAAFGPDCRSAATNPLDSAAGENAQPTADFTWTPDPATAGEPVTFTSTATDPDGDIIHYGWDFDTDGTEDATGAEVTHTFETAGDHDVKHTVIDDFDATDSGTKTVTIEELGKRVAKLLADDGAEDDLFGWSVALSADGTTALVGVRLDDENGTDAGAAYVFTRSAGTWSQQAKLLASDGTAGDFFGYSVALDAHGTTALIGAMHSDHNGRSSGSAYVFTRSADTWSQQAKLLADDGDQGDQFGRSVALAGDTALIGAIGDDDNGHFSGSAYVFTRSAGTWSQQAKLLADDGAAASDLLGFSVALAADGTTALVGARGNSTTGRTGSAYVFSRSAGTWSQQAKLLADDGDEGDYFGWSVALSGDATTALVGAVIGKDNVTETGAAYVFSRSADTWSKQAKLLAEDGDEGDYFGSSVALDADGTTALVGAREDDITGGSSGSAYVFTRSAGTWSQQAKLLADDGAAGDLLGFSAALAADGTTALIGAPGGDTEGGTNAGAAYVFRRW